ncbi:MAG: hypothetical protein Q8O76_08455, partial [Chloroflexota bacterium]|nr:hypothetical protein [Chloroflexota bacterium]
VVTQLRYSFGIIEKPAQFGRFDYRQKFEYWGIIFGGMVMLGTGFILAYPVPFTQIFPGEFIPAAKEFHRNEAMLAVLTVVVWHLYDTVFKPGIFPCDLSILTGKLSRHRMMEEHPLEFAELAAEAGKKTEVAPSEESSSGSTPP